ncbi:aminoacyl-tRNA hydrolase [Desulfurobacterium atlanticum]|uniref:Peptidyl-tRNA hydrolase n=1 Tax=Desulfurobacterium atlanticum TaxID=240169 RepID=A0A238ZG02_9BACT|nr:aminoacyl-tRNA hydrolase [Desulfurobacterium atlanticum]SNR82435.1 peptidyl-tRNA hydrolase [Desulfurobacterium atlanticum]
MVKLVVGLGNPGKEYAKTRHNVGWMVLDKVANQFEEPFSKEKFKGVIAEIQSPHGKVILLKPLTYMNRSGESVAEAVKFYKLNPEEILVISDDLDMPVGKVRMRKEGKHGGHRGLMSIEEKLGSSRFPRIKIGIGRPERKEMVANYVLQPFSKEQLPIIEMAIDEATRWVTEIIDGKPIEAKTCSF